MVEGLAMFCKNIARNYAIPHYTKHLAVQPALHVGGFTLYTVYLAMVYLAVQLVLYTLYFILYTLPRRAARFPSHASGSLCRAAGSVVAQARSAPRV